MTKRPIHTSGVHIGKLRLRGRVLRDLINSNTPVEIEEMEVDADIGGDVINKKLAPKQPTRRKRRERPARPIRKTITHALLGAASIATMVAASGIAAAFGWT